MSKKIVGSHTKVKKHHKELIVAEAVRLNGSARSTQGRSQLIRFAQKECGIMIDARALNNILKGQPNGNGAHVVVSKPPCKTRGARVNHHR